MKCLYLLNLLVVLARSWGSWGSWHSWHSYTHGSTPCDEDWSSHTNYDVDADRVYSIACVEEEWNYCPTGNNVVSGESINEGSPEATWCLGNGRDRIGPTYLKALYREYETNCFDERKDRSDRDRHLGVLGPNIRATTGETIKIFYKNTCSFPTSMHPHGLEYDKTSEGAPYNDGSTDGDIVHPGDTWIYIWKARSNMVDDNVDSQMWLYHSHVDEPRDVMTGLVGAIIITKDDSDLTPDDVDRDFTTFFVLFDENESHLFDENVDRFLGFRGSDTGADAVLQNDEFHESNLMHSINGYLFGNLRYLDCEQGEKVRWYTASLGNELDGPHSPHWHGNIAKDAQGHNTDTVVLIPGTTKDVTMKVDAKGIWLYHCHVHDHIDAGMMTTYEVS